MSDEWTPSSDLVSLTNEANSDGLNEDGAARLAVLLRDKRACRWYRDYCLLHVELRFLALADRINTAAHGGFRPELGVPATDEVVARGCTEGEVTGLAQDPAQRAEPFVDLPIEYCPESRIADVSFIAPIIVTPSASPRAPLFSFDSPFGNFVFSYSASAVVLCIAMFLGWAYKLSNVRPDHGGTKTDVVRDDLKLPATPAAMFVGRVTGLVDCQWPDPLDKTQERSVVRIGRTYRLSAGFLEVTYDSGARVILQGPCVYRVDSPRSGFLQVGKLTAKVGTRGEGRGTGGVASESRASNPQSLIPNPSPPSPLAPRPSPLFVITTPTAVVTDLGTEFGVEVKESGATRSHVFQGRIEVHAANGDMGQRRSVLLGKGESVTVAPNAGRDISITHETLGTRTFVRQMPKRTPIAVFNTGIGLRELRYDPHWQIVARSDDPKFRHRLAGVSPLGTQDWLNNDPQNSQWIVLVDPYIGNKVCYTFRTIFTLTDLVPGTAALRGRLIADNYVKAIRINGKPVPMPNYNKLAPLNRFQAFSVIDGFVEGDNVLEFDVYCKWQGRRKPDGRPTGDMGLRVELSGFYVRQETKPRRTNVETRAAGEPRRGGRPTSDP